MSGEIERSSLGKRLAANGELAAEVLEKTRQGETPLAIAKWLQEDLLAFTEAGVEELAGAVKEHYLRELSLGERLEIHRQGRSAIAKTVAKQRQHRSARERLELLLDLQLGRLELAHADEDEGRTNPTLANEIEIARRIAMNLHQVEQEAGSTDVPKGSGGLAGALGTKLGLIVLQQVQREQIPVEDVGFKAVDE